MKMRLRKCNLKMAAMLSRTQCVQIIANPYQYLKVLTYGPGHFTGEQKFESQKHSSAPVMSVAAGNAAMRAVSASASDAQSAVCLAKHFRTVRRTPIPVNEGHTCYPLFYIVVGLVSEIRVHEQVCSFCRTYLLMKYHVSMPFFFHDGFGNTFKQQLVCEFVGEGFV